MSFFLYLMLLHFSWSESLYSLKKSSTTEMVLQFGTDPAKLMCGGASIIQILLNCGINGAACGVATCYI